MRGALQLFAIAGVPGWARPPYIMSGGMAGPADSFFSGTSVTTASVVRTMAAALRLAVRDGKQG